MSKVIEKMNIYLITKDNVKPLVKEGRWFNDLFLPLFKSNKDPLKKQPQLNDYWNEIRDVLLGKKKNSNLKVIKNKDMKFIAFNVANNQILAFVSGTDKKEELSKIYELTQLKGDKFTYEKYLSINKAKDTAAMKWSYDNLFNISEKDIKDWGYKNIEDMIKKNVGRADNDIDSPYCNNKKIGTYVEMSNWGIKEWAKMLLSHTNSKTNWEGIFEQDTMSSCDAQMLGDFILYRNMKFSIKDANGYNEDVNFGDIIESYANKEVIEKLDKITEILGACFIKKPNKRNNKETYADKLVKELDQYMTAVGSDIIPGQICDDDPDTMKQEFKDSLGAFIEGYTDAEFTISKGKNGTLIKFKDGSQVELEIQSINGFACVVKYNGKYLNGHPYKNLNNKPTKNLCIEAAINWISEHDQAWEDFLNVCQFDNNNLKMDEEKAMYKAISEGKIDLAFIVNWISEHDTLYKDFKNYFGLSDKDIEKITSKNNFEGTGMSEEDIHNLSNEDMEELGVNDNQFYKFKVYLYQNSNDFESFEEYKKLEHHFEWLIGDDFKGIYRNIKVIDHITNQDDPVLIIEGEVAGISKDDFFEDLIAGADENYDLSDGDIVEWKKV